jgi:hypothetical protein
MKLATHQASIATVTQMTDGTGIKELRDDAILFDVMDLKRLATTPRWIKSPNVLYETLEALIDEINMSSEREKFSHYREACGIRIDHRAGGTFFDEHEGRGLRPRL